MSGTIPSMTPAPGDPPEKDQSMDDILASIRRIMLDEQARLQDSPAASPSAYTVVREQDAGADPVLILDGSMVVEDRPAERLAISMADETVMMVSIEAAPAPADPTDASRTVDAGYTIVTEMVPPDAAAVDVPMEVTSEPYGSTQTTVAGAAGGGLPLTLGATAQQIALTSQTIEALLAPAAAAAAAASVEALLKQLGEERLAALHAAPSPSPTIEEVVRAELRPFLKVWLDEHLPLMVERLVRVEITRLIGRSGF